MLGSFMPFGRDFSLNKLLKNSTSDVYHLKMTVGQNIS